MSMPVADQAWTLLAALFLGNALALVFDALRALRRRLRTALGRCGLDVLFALLTWVVYTVLDYGKTLQVQSDETL